MLLCQLLATASHPQEHLTTMENLLDPSGSRSNSQALHLSASGELMPKYLHGLPANCIHSVITWLSVQYSRFDPSGFRGLGRVE